MTSDLHFRLIRHDQTWPLRHRVLRTGRPLSTCRWDGDEQHSTHHFGLGAGASIVAIGSLYHRDHDLAPGPDAWQLRGMAVDPNQARRGIGSLLLRNLQSHCRDQLAGTTMWCNARTSAAGFYEKHAFVVLSDIFDVPGVGPHVVMSRSLLADEIPA